MPLLHDELLNFTGWHGSESRCRVRVFTPPDSARESGYVVMLTDDQDAQGTSITNAAERLAALICAQHHIPQARAQFIEHYDYRHTPEGHDGNGNEQSFARVNFRVPESVLGRTEYIHGLILGEPDWKHIDRDSVEILIGEPLP